MIGLGAEPVEVVVGNQVHQLVADDALRSRFVRVMRRPVRACAQGSGWASKEAIPMLLRLLRRR